MDIIATIGPTLETFDDISKAIQKGVTTFRLGFGYRSRDQVALIKTIRNVEKSIKTKVFIMVDLPSSRPRISSNIEFNIKKNDFIYICRNDNLKKENTILVNDFDYILRNTNIGGMINLLDGRLKFKVEFIDKDCIELLCIEGNGTLKTSNSITIESKNEPYKLILDEDKDIFRCLNKNNLIIDWIAFSFSEDKNQIQKATQEISDLNFINIPKVIAKIETIEAVYQLNRIASVVDGIMVARGDLAVNLNFKPIIAEVQNQIIKICKKNNLYSIVATELLENFAETGIMSRSEISDLSLSISQNPSALQLGKETVYSSRPFKAIEILKEFINYGIYRNELDKANLPKKIKCNSKNMIVAIEGANGAGKSTLCRYLCDYFNTSIKFGVPDLFLKKELKEKMIIDANWYSSSLFFISGAIEQVREFRNSDENIIIFDRSIWSTLSVQACENPKNLKPLVDIVFNLKNINIEPDITIILRANYETCRDRISKKSTDEQKLDELVNRKEFYQKEDQFYDWLTFQRENIINIDVNRIDELSLSEKVIEIIRNKYEDTKQ